MKKFINILFILLLSNSDSYEREVVIASFLKNFEIKIDHTNQTILPGEKADYYLEVLLFQKSNQPVILELENSDKNLHYQFSSQKIKSSGIVKLSIWHQNFKKEYDKFPIIVSARNAASQAKIYYAMWLYIFNPTKIKKLISLTIGNSDSLKQGVIQTIEGRVVPPGIEQVQLILHSPSREKHLITINVNKTGHFFHNYVFSQSGWWKATILNPGLITIGSDSFYVLPRTTRIALTTQNHQFKNSNDSLLILGQVVADKYPMNIQFQINSPGEIKDSNFTLASDKTGHFQTKYPVFKKGMYSITASVNPEETICVDIGESRSQHAILMYDGSNSDQNTYVNSYLLPSLNGRSFQDSEILKLDIHNSDNYNFKNKINQFISPITKKNFLLLYLTGVTSEFPTYTYHTYNNSGVDTSISFESLTHSLIEEIAAFDTLVYFFDCDFGEILLKHFADSLILRQKPLLSIGISSNKAISNINNSFTKTFRDRIDEDYDIKDAFYFSRTNFQDPFPVLDDNGKYGRPDGYFKDLALTGPQDLSYDGLKSENIKIGCTTGEREVLCELSDAEVQSNPSIGPLISNYGRLLAVFDNPNRNHISEVIGTVTPPSLPKLKPNKTLLTSDSKHSILKKEHTSAQFETIVPPVLPKQEVKTVSLMYDSSSGIFKSDPIQFPDLGTYTVRLNYTYSFQNLKNERLIKFDSYTFQTNRYDKQKTIDASMLFFSPGIEIGCYNRSYSWIDKNYYGFMIGINLISERKHILEFCGISLNFNADEKWIVFAPVSVNPFYKFTSKLWFFWGIGADYNQIKNHQIKSFKNDFKQFIGIKFRCTSSN